jgi:hypothetical protein
MAELMLPRVDFATLGDLPNIYREGAQRAARERTLAELGSGQGPLDYNEAARRLLAVGDREGAMSLAQLGANLQQREYQRSRDAANDAFRREEAARSQRNADRAFGLQQRQLQATIEGGKVPPGFVRSSDGGLMPVPGGPSDPAYLARRAEGEAQVKTAAANRELQQGGAQVLSLVDQLEAKVRDPKFSSAAGPIAGALHDQPLYNPARIGYEIVQSRANKTFLDQIKQDAQGITTVMQRALLKGGGSITENERAQINEILGKIATARSAEDAQALLNNFRGIVRGIFQMDRTQGGAPAAPSPARPASPSIPAPPPGFQLVQ